jgi:O-glycosyl hydrolase
MAFMVKRAEYRKEKEASLFNQVLQWARADDDEIVVEIVERAFADDDSEHWLTIHPTSSYTGLISHYTEVIASEKKLTFNERRLLDKRIDAYSKRLLK